MEKKLVYLTYAGALPFIICAVFLSIGIHHLPLIGSIKKILSAYGLLITAFLTGSLWGQNLHCKKRQWNRLLPILSNVMAISLWLGFSLLNFTSLITLLSAVLFLLVVIDYNLMAERLISSAYFRTRLLVTIIVIISLTISGISA